ncbi:MAG: DUF308 domain-containing protein [Clostridia bacterium]|nr:DUF308 domain-containing protein [Clostridia bacterium]
MRSVKLIRAAKAGYIILSAAFCALGALMIARPDLSQSLVGTAVGAALMAFGAVKLAGYFSRDLYRLAFQFDLAFGGLLLIIGAAILLRPGGAMNALCAVMAVEIIADALFKLQTALDAKRFGLERWWLILAAALLAAATGVALALHPAQGARALTALLGVSLAAEGALNLCVALCAVKIVSNQRPDGAAPRFYTK